MPRLDLSVEISSAVAANTSPLAWATITVSSGITVGGAAATGDEEKRYGLNAAQPGRLSAESVSS